MHAATEEDETTRYLRRLNPNLNNIVYPAVKDYPTVIDYATKSNKAQMLYFWFKLK